MTNDVHDPLISAFLATILYAGVRPSEASTPRISDSELPEFGWGILNLTKSASRSTTAWTNAGDTRDDRGLKHRAPGATRTLPTPQQLVEALKAVTAERTDGYVFATKNECIISDATISRHWKRARKFHNLDGELRRIYDLGHLCASTWITAGLPTTEIAAKLGPSPGDCLRVYAHNIESQRDHYNTSIRRLLA